MPHSAFKDLSLEAQRTELIARLQRSAARQAQKADRPLRLVPAPSGPLVVEYRSRVHRGLKWTGTICLDYRRIDDPAGECIAAECKRCLGRFPNVPGAYARLRTHQNQHTQADAFQARLQIEFDIKGIHRAARRDIKTGRLLKGD